MNLTGDTWLNLAIQIPLAMVIVFLVLKFLDHLKENNKAMLTFIGEQAEINRSFLATQREQQQTALNHMAEEIRTSKTETIKELASLTNSVDKTIEKMLEMEREREMYIRMSKEK